MTNLPDLSDYMKYNLRLSYAALYHLPLENDDCISPFLQVLATFSHFHTRCGGFDTINNRTSVFHAHQADRSPLSF